MSESAKPDLDWSPPERFEEYRILRLLGAGGMGAVYLAEDTLLARRVAIKFITAAAGAARERFFLEARAAARLKHPNVVTVHRVGKLGDRPYIVSEFIGGAGLDQLSRPVPWKRALEIGLDLARGLGAAHRQGVLHRDIKPANAMITRDGQAMLVDFGLAKFVAPTPRTGTVIGAPSDDQTADVVAAPPESPTADVIAAPPEAPTADVAMPASGPNLTAVGTVMGTPLYLSPESWMGFPATTRSDVYSLGVLLYELVSGKPPHADAGRDLPMAVVQREAPPLTSAAPGVNPRFAEIVERCLARDPGRRYASGEELRDALDELAAPAETATVPEGNPYRGLLPFEAEHRALFFGRGADIRGVVERLRSDSFVLVAGESGVGKSSLCRAGVLPQFVRDQPDGRAWSAVTFVPGRRPLSALSSALAAIVPEELFAPAIRESTDETARKLRTALGAERGLLLFVDQLEELVTAADPEEARIVSLFLAQLADFSPSTRLLATVRGDFVARVASLPELGARVASHLHILRPMSEQSFRETIVGPARATGVRFESDALVDRLVQSTVRAEGGLPLLQFTLAELWDRRDTTRGIIPAAALDAAGGVAGALALHADSVIATLPPPERAAARRVLLRLVTQDRTRVRRTATELGASDPAARAALESLVDGRLFVAREVDGETAYEIAHEALVTSWSTLRQWIDDQAGTKGIHERISAGAGEWERMGRRKDALWSERQLEETSRIDPDDLTGRERAFVDASKRSVRNARRARWIAAGGLALFAASVYGGVRAVARHDLNVRIAERVREGDTALADARAKAAALAQARAEAFALFDAEKNDEAEKRWSEALVSAQQTAVAYSSAERSLESAVLLDPARTALRHDLAAALFEQAGIDAEAHDDDHRDELVERMSVYDPGEFAALLAAPAHVDARTDPPGATIAIERYVRHPDGTRAPEPAGERGPTPVADLVLDPGSYRLTFRAPGRVLVREPVVVGPGERLAVDVALPAEDAVPADFVYVPAGRFLFGSAGDEGVRHLWGTVPLHSRESAPFLIARHETTYGEWIAFLRDLPAAERSRRLPATANGVLAVALEVSPSGGFALRFESGGHRYRAGEGEPLVYLDRPDQTPLDWKRLPVTGISWEDAVAYAAWLDRTGRVPGARPCQEDEWERAARGADDRLYPHGDSIHPADADFDETYDRKPFAMGPDPVGSHPRSRSPFDVDDLAGNAFEMMQSSLVPGELVERGGAYFFVAQMEVTINRAVIGRSQRDPTTGVRICAAPPAMGR